MAEQPIEVDDIWIERIPRRLGFDSLSDRLTGSTKWAPYAFIITAIGIHLPLLSVVGWLRTGTLSIEANPGELFQILAWPAVVWILIRTKRKYATTIADLPDAIDEDVRTLDVGSGTFGWLLSLLGVPRDPTGKADARIGEIAPSKVRYGLLCAGWAFYGWQLITDPSGLVGPVAEMTGPIVATIRFYLIIPLVLYPIGVEFLTVIVGALVLLPFKIRRARLVDFSDPHGFAGLAPSGEMFKSVAVSYFVLLTVFMMFQTVAVGASPTDQFSLVLLVAGLLVGLVLFFGPMLWVKSFVATAKEAKIEALADRSREVGPTEDIFPYAEPESVDDANQYTYNHIRMQRVEMTSEFPTDFAMIQEVLFALLLPYVTSLAFDFALQNAL